MAKINDNYNDNLDYLTNKYPGWPINSNIVDSYNDLLISFATESYPNRGYDQQYINNFFTDQALNNIINQEDDILKQGSITMRFLLFKRVLMHIYKIKDHLVLLKD